MLTIAPDMSAEIGPGACGCARGSHGCSGTAPALDANPTRTSTNTTDASGADSCRRWLAMTANPCPPACVASSSSPRRMAAAPMWVIAPYHWAASRVSGRRCSMSTASSDVSAMSSHATRKLATEAAAGTRSIVARKAGCRAVAVRPGRAWAP